MLLFYTCVLFFLFLCVVSVEIYNVIDFFLFIFVVSFFGCSFLGSVVFLMKMGCLVVVNEDFF